MSETESETEQNSEPQNAYVKLDDTAQLALDNAMEQLREWRGPKQQWELPVGSNQVAMVLYANIGSSQIDPKLLDANVQKAMMKTLKAMLLGDLGTNQRFVEKTDWPWLNKLLTAARIKELSLVKIAKLTGKSRAKIGYNMRPLLDTFFGRKILAQLNFDVSRRKVADEQEYEKIRAAFAALKLKLPETVNPTVAEEYFG